MILVIGGRSKIGASLLELLVARGQRVRALVRGAERGAASMAGVESVAGDLAVPDSLRAAMTGVEKVFLLSSPHRDAVQWHRHAIDAARAAGVSLLVRSSILGAGEDSPAEFVQAHTVCDRYLEASGLAHAILRPNLFQQNIPESKAARARSLVTRATRQRMMLLVPDARAKYCCAKRTPSAVKKNSIDRCGVRVVGRGLKVYTPPTIPRSVFGGMMSNPALLHSGISPQQLAIDPSSQPRRTAKVTRKSSPRLYAKTDGARTVGLERSERRQQTSQLPSA